MPIPLMPLSLMPLTRRLLLLAVLCGTAAGAALGQEVQRSAEEQAFPPSAQVAGEPLLLNGTGVRAVAWFKGYAAGLYLSRRVHTAAEALALAGPKRLQLRMLHEVPAAEFVKALKKGIHRNTAPQERAAVAGGVQRFADEIAALELVHKGDIIDLDLDPARGLLFTLNGKLHGQALADAAVYAALLRAFIGEHPYDERLKAGLLARPATRAPAPTPY